METRKQHEGASTARGRAVREYLYIEQLAELTPWSADAIRTMMARGKFQRGVHYFKHGEGSRPIFSWKAVVEYIEREGQSAVTGDVVRLANGAVVDVDEAA